MNQSIKDQTINTARKHVTAVRKFLDQELEAVRKKIGPAAYAVLRTLRPDDQLAQVAMLEQNQKRALELEQLLGSPYFVRCRICFDDTRKTEDLYFAKFQCSEESIYSWTSPVATLRFESPGRVAYPRPDGSKRAGDLMQKDQYFIVHGSIVFLSTESTKQSRELVYQDYFSHQKSSFALPEIVAQMEKAQDQVIRAPAHGPLLISGPAGSGKTTLALHRIAYLTQSPDTAREYSGESILVFVQDSGTREYFSQLLPSLGITDVTITTFAQWALRMLGGGDFAFVPRFGNSEEESDEYEYAKCSSLTDPLLPVFRYDSLYDDLRSIYDSAFGERAQKIFKRQMEERVLDRFDLTLALLMKERSDTRLSVSQEYFEMRKDHTYRKRMRQIPAEYALILIDEFQNYLPVQLELMQRLINPATASLVYVGDAAQQIFIGTACGSGIVSSMDDDRRVKLTKVYRNTRQILEYIGTLGYAAEVPADARSGPVPYEKAFPTLAEEIGWIAGQLKERGLGLTGILAFEPGRLQILREHFGHIPSVRVMSARESQGVEFETVFLSGADCWLRARAVADAEVNESLLAERRHIQKDLLYIALTRAISRLFTLGQEPLSHFFIH